MEGLASTKDVLGDHLHQKIKEVLFDDDSGDKVRFISKITGVLLERPVEDIFKMLTDKNILLNNIKIAGDSVRNERLSSCKQDLELICSDTNKVKMKISSDEISQQLYQKVFLLNPDLAPQITGILLEMDKEAVKDILKDDSEFMRAFDKAKSCLKRNGMDLFLEEENFSFVIYRRAEILYKDLAPKLTGMILELEPATLKQIVGDQHSLDKAITRAYRVLSAKDDSS